MRLRAVLANVFSASGVIVGPPRYRAARTAGLALERRPTKVATVALANKIARMAWAIMVRGERYNEPKLPLAA